MLSGFPGGTSGKEPACQGRRPKRHGLDPWVGKVPLEEGMATHFSVLAWRIPWTEEWQGTVHRVAKSWTGLKRLSATCTHARGFHITVINFLVHKMGFSGGSDSKPSACNAGDLGLIPGSGRSPGEENGDHSSTLAWKIPWTEEPGRLYSSWDCRVGHD